MDKKTARTYALKTRKDIPIELRNDIAEQLINNLMKHEVFKLAKRVGLYYPIEGELNLLSIIEQFPNKEFYLPCVQEKTLIYRQVSSLEDLIEAPFGLKEPNEKQPTCMDCDLYIIPAVATSGLLRIGYGKGYFDTYLKDKNGYKLGVTYPIFKMQEIEQDDHDILMDEVL